MEEVKDSRRQHHSSRAAVACGGRVSKGPRDNSPVEQSSVAVRKSASRSKGGQAPQATNFTLESVTHTQGPTAMGVLSAWSAY